MDITQQITERYLLIAPVLDERSRRLVSAAEAKVLGYGGISVVSHATGVSRKAIGKGLAELDAAPVERLPRVGCAAWAPDVSHW